MNNLKIGEKKKTDESKCRAECLTSGIMDVLCGNNPVVGGCPVPFRVFSSMPGLWPVDPSTCPARFMSDKPKMVPDGHCQMSPRRQDYHDLRPLV